MLLHHSLGDGDYEVFENMSRRISCATAVLDVPSTAAAMIDDTLRACWLQGRPVYIAIPSDMSQKIVDGGYRVQTPIDLTIPRVDNLAEGIFVDAIFRSLGIANGHPTRRPAILVDVFATRQWVGELRRQKFSAVSCSH